MSTTTTTTTTSQTKKPSIWFSKQSVAADALATVKGALGGAAYGAFMGLFFKKTLPGGSLITARNVAAAFAVYEGTLSVMKRIREKEDVESCMTSGFGSGAVYSLFRGVRSVPQVTMIGLACALVCGGAHKATEMLVASEQHKEGLKDVI